MSEPKKSASRYVLAAVYTGDEDDIATHVLLQITPSDLLVAERAMKFAGQFDDDFDNAYGRSTLTTGGVGGEHVLTSLPEELEEWVSEQDDPMCEYAILLPQSLNDLVDRVIDQWRTDLDLEWPSSNLRLKCSKTEIHAEAEAKNVADLYVWTRDLAPVFELLKADFETKETPRYEYAG